MSSLTVSVESEATLMSDWKDVITQLSSPWATGPDNTTAQMAAMTAIANRAARIVTRVLTQIRRQCYATYYAAIPYFAPASANPVGAVVEAGGPPAPKNAAD